MNAVVAFTIPVCTSSGAAEGTAMKNNKRFEGLLRVRKYNVMFRF